MKESVLYGLTGTDTFLVYMEGTPVSEISEEVYSWLSMANKSDTAVSYTHLDVYKRQVFGFPCVFFSAQTVRTGFFCTAE